MQNLHVVARGFLCRFPNASYICLFRKCYLLLIILERRRQQSMAIGHGIRIEFTYWMRYVAAT